MPKFIVIDNAGGDNGVVREEDYLSALEHVLGNMAITVLSEEEAKLRFAVEVKQILDQPRVEGDSDAKAEQDLNAIDQITALAEEYVSPFTDIS